MSEYIMEIPEYPAKVVQDGWNTRIEWEFKQREKIVRCKDCKYASEVYWPENPGITSDYLDCYGELVETWDYYYDEPKYNPRAARRLLCLGCKDGIMSEYIVTCDEETALWIGNDVDSMKPLVRCRDCRYYKCGDDGWWCLRSISTKSNHPDGFCAWGERRE